MLLLDAVKSKIAKFETIYSYSVLDYTKKIPVLKKKPFVATIHFANIKLPTKVSLVSYYFNANILVNIYRDV